MSANDPTYMGRGLAGWQELIERYGSISATAVAGGVSRSGLSSALARLKRAEAELLGVDPPVAAGGPEAPPCAPMKPDDILREQGMDPSHWQLLSATRLANGKMNVRARPTPPDPLGTVAATDPREFVPPQTGHLTGQDSLMIVVESDHQAPHNDPTMDALATEWWRRNQPDMAVFDGDLIELHTLSRHPTPRGGSASVRRCFDAGHAILERRLEASPGTDIVVLPGNHDDRVMDYLMREASALVELGALGPLSLSALLRLDELKGSARMYEHPLGWRHTELPLAPDLIVCHAVTPPRGAGQTARGAMLKAGKSAIVGDCHRQELSSAQDGRLGFAIGCMCLNDDTYPAYMTRPTWQHGFATVSLYADKSWHVEFATRHGDDLFWRGERYSV